MQPLASNFPTIEWFAILPILLVVLTGMAALLIELVSPKRNNDFIIGVSIIGLALAAIPALMSFGESATNTAGNMFVRDNFGLVMELLLLLIAFLSVLFSESYLRNKRVPFGEFYPLLLWSTAGGMVMSTSNNLLVIFLGLEVLSVALYVMAGMSRSEEKSEESALKYFLLGAFASGFLLYGIAFLYGASGSLYLPDIYEAWFFSDPSFRGLMLFGVGLMIVGLGFKAAFVPFHQWTPDVYQGAPTNVTAFMAAGSKVAAFAALWRVLTGCLGMGAYWLPALYWIAILTMTVGNLIALMQKDTKRILAYSSIAHAGYILVGIVAHFKDTNAVSATAVSYYLLSYTLMTVGAFAVISLAARNGVENTSLAGLRGLRKRSLTAAVALALFMFSLMGMPPTAGFIGKFLIFTDALKVGLPWLAGILAINSVISIYYYMSIVVAAFVSDEEGTQTAPFKGGTVGAALICSVGVIAVVIFYSPLIAFLQLR